MSDRDDFEDEQVFRDREVPPGDWRINNPDWPSGEGPYLVPEDDEPMPPFPQEPAPGSAQAVEVAARTIRGFTPGPWKVVSKPGDMTVGKGSRALAALLGLPDAEKIANARLMAAAPDLLAENERLRASIGEAWGSATDWRIAAENMEGVADALEAVLDFCNPDWRRERYTEVSAYAQAFEALRAAGRLA